MFSLESVAGVSIEMQVHPRPKKKARSGKKEEKSPGDVLIDFLPFKR